MSKRDDRLAMLLHRVVWRAVRGRDRSSRPVASFEQSARSHRAAFRAIADFVEREIVPAARREGRSRR